MKKTLLLLLTAASLLSLQSCKKSDDPVAPPGSNNITNPPPFIKVGNKWTYNTSSLLYPYTTFSAEITENNGGIYTQLGIVDNTPPGTKSYFYGAGGYLNAFDEGDTKANNQFYYKYPGAKVGDKWTRITPSETYYHEVMSVGEMVTVPAGTFACTKVKVTFLNAFNEQYTYWSDVYGIIKVDNDILLSMELASKNF